MVSCDEQMYYEELNLPCNVRSSNLVQELGQVSNVFSDKTGTLTRNEMKFVNFVVENQLYDVEEEGELYTEDIRQADGKSLPSKPDGDRSRVMSILSGPDGEQHKLYDFLRCLTTCHTVLKEKSGTLRAESPDELALIEGIKKFRCGLKDRTTGSMTVEILGKIVSYEILAVNAFNSDRKRMSILLKDNENGEYFLMCKGSDSVMMDLCSIQSAAEHSSINKSLTDLACLGLRILVVACKRIEKNVAKEWIKGYRNASTALRDRAKLLAAAAEEIEKDLCLVGITAVEDKLQDSVPEVIADLSRAGIVLWMLTGDKEETAVNIGRTCNLVLSNTKVFYLTKMGSRAAFAEMLQEIFEDVERYYVPGEGYKRGIDPVRDVALVIDGRSFDHLQVDYHEQCQMFLAVGRICRSVIGCSLTPIQKQLVVHLVKVNTTPRAITLAIGDGANDVSMIREADVGVGIFGKEGRQAANNSDFAIGQFKYLRRLLLLHGRWNYMRQAKVFLYCMHKNQVVTLTLFWYNYFCAMSGTSFYESWVYTGFNFILGLPIVFLGIQDKDISANFIMQNPQVR
jgi:phospholipid-translocating P-type ATPase (flippase)